MSMTIVLVLQLCSLHVTTLSAHTFSCSVYVNDILRLEKVIGTGITHFCVVGCCSSCFSLCLSLSVEVINVF